MPKTKKKQQHSQRFLELQKKFDDETVYDVEEAVKLVKENATAKFPESVDLAVRLGIDPKKSEQNVRGTTSLPHGTGRTQKVAVLAAGEAAREAEEAGADTVGDEDLIKNIQEGFRDFDIMIAHSDMAPQIGKIGRFLGPKTPNKRNGTVTDQVGQAVKEIKSATRIEYRIDKAANVHLLVGKVSFSEDQILENIKAALDAVIKAKPAGAKGRYLKSITISSTMGPGFSIDPVAATKFAGH